MCNLKLPLIQLKMKIRKMTKLKKRRKKLKKKKIKKRKLRKKKMKMNPNNLIILYLIFLLH